MNTENPKNSEKLTESKVVNFKIKKEQFIFIQNEMKKKFGRYCPKVGPFARDLLIDEVTQWISKKS